MEITLYESDVLFDDLEAEWGDLLTNSTADRIFLTHTWLSKWWAAYHPGAIWSLVFRNPAGELMGIAPWFRTTEDDGSRVVRPIGCVDVTDYLEVITRQGSEESVFAALTDWMEVHRAEFDMLRLCNIPEASPMMTIWADQLAVMGFDLETRVEDVCPIIQLPNNFPDYIAGLDKKNRHELRRKLRNAIGKVDWYIVGPEHDFQVEMATFLDLMAASSEDKALFLQDNRNLRFFESVMPEIAALGWLQLAILTVEGNPAATYLNFDYGNRILVYNSGLNPVLHGNLSPGIVLLGRLIEYAIKCKRDVVDFLRGDESYKYDMGGQNTRVYRMEIS